MPALQREARSDGVVWLSINSGHPGAEGDFSPVQVAEWLRLNGGQPTAPTCATRTAAWGISTGRRRPRTYSSFPPRAPWCTRARSTASSADVDDIYRATNYVKAALAALKSGSLVAITATRAYGCAVKY